MAKQIFDVTATAGARFSVNKDLSPYDMPPTFFNDGVNVRFLDGKAGKILGHSQALIPHCQVRTTGKGVSSVVSWSVQMVLMFLRALYRAAHSLPTSPTGLLRSAVGPLYHSETI